MRMRTDTTLMPAPAPRRLCEIVGSERHRRPQWVRLLELPERPEPPGPPPSAQAGPLAPAAPAAAPPTSAP